MEEIPGIAAPRVEDDDGAFGLLLAGGERETSAKNCGAFFATEEENESGEPVLLHVTGIRGPEDACGAFRLIDETMGVLETSA